MDDPHGIVTRWAELRGVHIDCDAVQVIARERHDPLYGWDVARLRVAGQAEAVIIDLCPTEHDYHTDPDLYVGYYALSPEGVVRWWHLPRRRVELRKRIDKARHDNDVRARAAREAADNRRAFQDARFAEIVATVTGARP